MTGDVDRAGGGLEVDVAVAMDDGVVQAAVEVDRGRVLAVLGPNGAGKTTVLRAIAGLIPLRSGTVRLDGEVLDDVAAGVRLAPERRQLGVVFQDLLLFPHLRVVDDVAFGCRAQGASTTEARRRARQLLEQLDLADLADRRTTELSGGQAQRVALARALGAGPRALLLDEPLAALDAGTRPQVRRQLARHLTEAALPTVLVTHDPIDALVLADEVAVLERGTIVQQGPVAEVTGRPRTAYVADLVGVTLLRGTSTGTQIHVRPSGTLHTATPIDGAVLAIVRPSAVTVHRREPEGSARNRWPVTVRSLELLGDRVRLGLDGPVPLVAEVTPAAVHDLALTEGSAAWASVKATEIDAYPA